MKIYDIIVGDGYVEIDNAIYPVNTLQVIFNEDLVAIWSATNRTNYVPFTKYDQFANAGTPFASKSDLKTFIQTNFFELASGNGGGNSTPSIPLSYLDDANGVPQMVNGKIKISQIPNSVMELQGFWNATTNTPSLADGVGNAGDVYEVSVGGTINLGSGNITVVQGDWIVYAADAIWHRSINSNEVVSVNGLKGAVTLTQDNVADGTIKRIINGGNTLGTDVIIGSTDVAGLILKTNNTNRLILASTTNNLFNAAGINYGNFFFGSTVTGMSMSRATADTQTVLNIINSDQTSTGNIMDFSSNVAGTIAVRASISKAGNITAVSFIKSGGTSSQFLKADGSVDSATYVTASSLGSYFVDGGNTATANMRLGTLNSYSLFIAADGTDMLQLYPTGGVTIKAPSAASYIMIWTTSLNSTMARLDTAGNFMAFGFVNRVSDTLAAIKTPSTGVVISRDVADANPSLIVNLINVGSTAKIVDFQKAGASKASIADTGKFTTIDDIELSTISKGIILKSPDGTSYRLTVADGGTAVFTAI